MRRKARELFSLLVIIFLLPYVVTLFMNGAHIKTSSRVKEDYVKVQVGTRVEEIVWEKYLAGVLAKEMAADSELEALKAQAVILRSGFYEKLDHDRKTIFTDDFYSMEELEQEWGGRDRNLQGEFEKSSAGNRSNDFAVSGSICNAAISQTECRKDEKRAGSIWKRVVSISSGKGLSKGFGGERTAAGVCAAIS